MIVATHDACGRGGERLVVALLGGGCKHHRHHGRSVVGGASHPVRESHH